jgi:hypothetical protein
MAFFNIQVLLKSSEIPEFRNNQQSGFTEKFCNSLIQKEFGCFSSDYPEIRKKNLISLQSGNMRFLKRVKSGVIGI